LGFPSRTPYRAKTNWCDSDDLAMMFHGTYTTDFYREVRTLLHEEIEARTSAGEVPAPWSFDARWAELERQAESQRSTVELDRQRRRRIATNG